MFPRPSDYLTWARSNTIIKNITIILDNWIKESKDTSILERFSEDLLVNKIPLLVLQKKYSSKLSCIADIFQNPKKIDKNLDAFMIEELKIEIRNLLNKYTNEYCKHATLTMS